MGFDELLAERVRFLFREHAIAFEEKNMMGGLCFMVDRKMCVGIEKDRLMARIGPDNYEAALSRTGCVPMDLTGRPMRGFVFVNPEGLESRRDLESWITLAIEFNPRAMSYKRKQRTKGQAGADGSKPSKQLRTTVRKRKK